MEEDALKIRNLPIRFSWARCGRSRSAEAVSYRVATNSADDVSYRVAMTNLGTIAEQNQNWWFRSPPKVRIVAGILGAHPPGCTRVIHRSGGEQNKGDDPESGHHSG